MFNKSILPLVGLFLIISFVPLVFRESFNKMGLDWQVLMGGNIFLYVVTTISFHLLREGMGAATTSAFLTKVYGSILLKLFGCAIAALAYIFISGSKLNKPALFTLMGLYLVYTFVEMRILMKHIKQQKDVRS